MDLRGVLARLDPLQQAAVLLVYFRGLSAAEAASTLAVEPTAVTAALSGTFRQLAAWVLADDVAPEPLMVHPAAS